MQNVTRFAQLLHPPDRHEYETRSEKYGGRIEHARHGGHQQGNNNRGKADRAVLSLTEPYFHWGLRLVQLSMQMALTCNMALTTTRHLGHKEATSHWGVAAPHPTPLLPSGRF